MEARSRGAARRITLAPSPRARLSGSLMLLLLPFILLGLLVSSATGQTPACGTTLREVAAYVASDGTVTTPTPPQFGVVPTELPGSYAANSVCSIIFYQSLAVQQYSSSNGTVISITFNFLNLNVGDTLELFLNNTLQTTLGPGSPADIININANTEDFLLLRFTAGPLGFNTSNNIGGVQFGFGAYIQTGGCLFGKALYTQEGTVTSGNYNPFANVYSPTLQCGFLIQTNGSALVDLTIQYDVESGFDFIYVYDGADSTAQLVRQLSGPGTNALSTFNFRSSSPFAYFELQTDKSVCFPGFTASWTFVPFASCSAVDFRTDSGIISDGSGDLNAAAQNCSWKIFPLAQANEIVLYFNQLDLGGGALVISDDSGAQLATYTGSYSSRNLPAPLDYKNGNLTMSFIAGSGAHDFSVVYHAGSCTAQVIVTERSGILNDGSGQGNYADNNLCKWLIDLRGVEGIKGVAFSFPAVNIEYRFDTLSVYDGDSTADPQIVSLSGPFLNTQTYSSSGPVILVVFKSDFSVNGAGWNMIYEPYFPADSSSDNTVIIVAIVVPVVVVGCLLFLFMLCILILMAVFLISRNKPKKKVYIEPDYTSIVFETIIPMLKEDISSYNDVTQYEDLEVEGHVALYSRLEKLILNVEFAHALLIGSKKSNEELNMSMLCKYLLLIYAFNGKARDLLLSETKKELQHSKANTLWRENSAVTTMFALYAKITAVQYIWKTLVVVLHDIKDLCEEAEKDADAPEGLPKTEYSGLELDPRRLSAQENALVNRLQLELISQRLLNAIIRSLPYFPEDLRKFFHNLRDEIATHFSATMANQPEEKVEKKIQKQYHKAAAGFLFLRLFSPAIIAPHEYGIYKEKPEKELQRFLILISKVLQNLSNGVYFRESYMENMNTFISKNLPTIRQYFDDLPEGTGSHISQLSKTNSQSEIGSHVGDALSIFDMENTNSSTESHNSESDIEANAPRELAMPTSANVPIYFKQNKKFSKAAREKTLQNLRFYAVTTAEDVDRVLETTLRNPDRKKLRKEYASFLEAANKVEENKKKKVPRFAGGASRKQSTNDPDRLSIPPLSPDAGAGSLPPASPKGSVKSSGSIFKTFKKPVVSKGPKKGGSSRGKKGKKIELMDLTELSDESSYTHTDTDDGFSDVDQIPDDDVRRPNGH